MARILIIDADADARMGLGKFLSASGHETFFASSGQEAMLSLANARFDLIVLDLTTPGMAGESFLWQLQQGRGAETAPMVVVTAIDTADAKARLGNLHVQGILIKDANLMDSMMKILQMHFAQGLPLENWHFEDPPDAAGDKTSGQEQK